VTVESHKRARERERERKRAAAKGKAIRKELCNQSVGQSAVDTEKKGNFFMANDVISDTTTNRQTDRQLLETKHVNRLIAG
jgi:hypothetical protein